ncbi:NAD(P)H-dependent oxidoreductase [Aureisphaera galaxeae]|uniref:NADPH-dependent FMN reductase n=1 Tax=Aureisphaera galaxeae TaxID=1538023 RepID=UPI002350A045|nr:NAD(P)H-dependent oxidoreductase [Aureisphaera galaxeae]MDC8004769.1 NAD(P)H-dependent oxidoreductase [Aureisphaera galaxeae]
MKKILAFAGSNSSTSINHKLVSHIASTIANHEISVIKLTDYPLPMYSEDLEKEAGFPSELSSLLEKIQGADGLIISVNEHNSGVSAFFKNVTDWLSRIERNYGEGKKVLVLSASPGGRGGLSANQYLSGALPRTGAEVVASVTFPSFYQNYSEEESRINDAELAETVSQAVDALLASL